MDLSRDGSVGWTEFVAACINLGGDEFEDTLREAFEEVDADRDGLLTQQDLGRLLPSGYAPEVASDVFSHLTGRMEAGARLDLPTFLQHFRARRPAADDGARRSTSGFLSVCPPAPAAPGGLALPDVLGLAREAADKVRSRWFPVPGPPEQEEEQLRRLADMGFKDRTQCLAVIRRHRNEISNSAVEELVNLAER